MNRRALITLLGGAAAVRPLAARTQQLELPRIGVLRVAGAIHQPAIEGLRQGLRDHGYVEGQNIAIEFRSGEGGMSQLRAASSLAKSVMRSSIVPAKRVSIMMF